MPRSREQFEEIKAARRQEIVGSAIRIFCKKGYDNAKIDDIMHDCSCSHGLMYHYFRNKDEIFRAILLSAAEHSDEMYRQYEAEKPSKETFGSMIRRYMSGIAEDETFAYFIHFMSTLNLIRHDFDYAELFRRYPQHRKPKEVMNELFRRGQAAGFIRQDERPEALATLLFAFFQGLAYQRVFSHSRSLGCEFPDPEIVISVFLAPTHDC